MARSSRLPDHQLQHGARTGAGRRSRLRLRWHGPPGQAWRWSWSRSRQARRRLARGKPLPRVADSRRARGRSDRTCGVDARHVLESDGSTVKRRLRDDLDSFRPTPKASSDQIEEWDFQAERSSPPSANSTTTRTHRADTAGCAGSWTRACFKRPASTARASRCCRSDSRLRLELRPRYATLRHHPHSS